MIPAVSNSVQNVGAHQDMLLFLANRFQRAMVKYSPDLPTTDRFMCTGYPDRGIFVVKLSVIGGMVTPAFSNAVEREMEGRRVVYRVYPKFSVAVFQVAYAINQNDFKVLPPFHGRQVVIYGGTGGGKTTTIKHVLAGRQGVIVVIDPHYQRNTGQWNNRWMIVGAGGKFDEIEQVIAIVHAEMKCRIQSTASPESHQPLHVAIDEMSNLLNDVSKDTIDKVYEIVRQGRKYSVFMVLTPHSVEVRAMGLEGTGGMRDSFLFIRMPRIRPGEESKPRVVDVFLGNPMHMNTPDGRYLIPPPTIYQGEPRLINPAELASMLGVSGGVPAPVSQPVPQAVSDLGHPQDSVGHGILPFEERYSKGKSEVIELVKYLVAHGYGVRKIGELLPYRNEDARLTVTEVAVICQHGQRPIINSAEEQEMIRELYHKWGVPINRLARLLDGADHQNILRVQSIVSNNTEWPA